MSRRPCITSTGRMMGYRAGGGLGAAPLGLFQSRSIMLIVPLAATALPLACMNEKPRSLRARAVLSPHGHIVSKFRTCRCPSLSYSSPVLTRFRVDRSHHAGVGQPPAKREKAGTDLPRFIRENKIHFPQSKDSRRFKNHVARLASDNLLIVDWMYSNACRTSSGLVLSSVLSKINVCFPL